MSFYGHKMPDFMHKKRAPAAGAKACDIEISAFFLVSRTVILNYCR